MPEAINNDNFAGQRLQQIMAGIDQHSSGTGNPEISSITADSRQVVPGGLFFAVCGGSHDGHNFVLDAVQAGAAAVVLEAGSACFKEWNNDQVIAVGVEDTQRALGIAAARFFGEPAEQVCLVGITGTNGKTTVTYLMEHVLFEAGFSVGVIGTIEYRFRGQDGTMIRIAAPYTTPDPLQLHAILRQMVDHGVRYVLMEVSSHALLQQRLGPIAFALALFTNLSQDHLDYHPSMEEYFQAKCLLFRKHLAAGAPVVVMEPLSAAADHVGYAARVAELCRTLNHPVIRCGRSAGASFKYLSSSLEVSGMSVACIDDAGMQRLLHSPLVGQFNVENLLVSLAGLVALGLDTDRVCESLTAAVGAPGRLQRVVLPDRPAGQPTVLVDYAHTPDALEQVLQTVRQLPHRTVFTLLGCGGDRDRGKRPLMGKIGATLSDVTIITDDNPRSEEPERIRAEIIAGIEQAGIPVYAADRLASRPAGEKICVEIGGRSEAIRAALTAAGPEDIILIAGKGHETYQIIGRTKGFFDDVLEAQQSALLWDGATIAAACGGTLSCRGAGARFGSVSTDSRKIRPGDIFVALKGESFNGHEFLDQAVAGGAGCLVVSDRSHLKKYTVPIVEVKDTLAALGSLASWRRQAIKKLQNPVVVAITGSCGKTTVKEMTAAIFRRRWPDRQDRPAGRVLKTVGNFNNLIGLPLSLLPASAAHRALVLEMGMNRPGEIAELTRIADPDIACIVNIHGAHLEGLGSIEGVARAKGELFAGTARRAVHVVNLDDERVVGCASQHERTIVGFAASPSGLARNPEIWAEDMTADAFGHLSLTLHAGRHQARLSIASPGLHNGVNACAAAAIAWAAGLEFDCIVAGLQDFRSAANRMESRQSPGGLNILNDTYNANPASMAAALRTLAALQAPVRVAILGDMLELGQQSEALHEELGRCAAAADLTFLGLIGNFSTVMKQGAIDGGMEAARIIVFEDKQRVVDWVAELMHSARLNAGDWVLVKASRGLALDTVVGQLLQRC